MTLTVEAVIGATPMTIVTLTPADIPDHHQDWCKFDVIDRELNKGQRY